MRAAALCSWKLRRRARMPKWVSSLRVVRVSSEAMRATSAEDAEGAGRDVLEVALWGVADDV